MNPAIERTPRNGWTGGQYSAWRVALGLTFLTYFAVRVWITATSEHAVPASFIDSVVAALHDWPRGTLLLVLTATWPLAGVAIVLGWGDRVSAAWLALGTLVLVPLTNGSAGLWLPAELSLPFALHAFSPRAPFGSLAARGRASPGGGWRYPDGLQLAVWLASALLVTWFFRQAFTPAVWSAMTWRDGVCLLGLLLAYVAGAAWRGARPVAWCVILLVDVLAYATEFAGAVPPRLVDVCITLVGLALLFDPAWIRAKDEHAAERLFYDGECGLCQRSVRFVLAEDTTRARFRFAPLQGETFARLVPEAERARLPDSVVVQRADGELLVRSDAAIHVLERLGGLWRVLGTCARLVPRPVRDFVYDRIARVRKSVFAAPKTACPLGPPEITARFDP